MTTLNPAAQLAAAIARADLAEQARDSAYLSHNLTRQRLDAALLEIERLKEEPACPDAALHRIWSNAYPEKPFPDLGPTATEFCLMANELAELRAEVADLRDYRREVLRRLLEPRSRGTIYGKG